MPFYDDDGNEIDPRSVAIPSLCKSCEKLDDTNEKILCVLTRLDQREDSDFKCYAYVNRYGVLDAVIVE